MKTRNILVLSAILADLALTSGCASIVDGSGQVLSVQTKQANAQEVDGAACTLANSKGTFFVTTPGTVTVHRDSDDLSVKCTKAGINPGIADVKSSVKGMAFGNILTGGIIGAAIDDHTGDAFDYPNLITVIMGKTEVIPAKPVKDAKTAENTPLPKTTTAK